MSAKFFIVALGASAGGLSALEQFFAAMPEDSGISFVVIQHLSPDFKSLMDDLLSRHTAMPIHQATNGIELEPNTIYLSPPRFLMELESGHITLKEKTGGVPVELAIDTFFRSMAVDCGDRAVGIVLSGTGSDGSRGIRAIRDAGGFVIVQTPDSAQFDGMPRNAIASSCYDFQMPPERIPRLLIEYIKDPAAVRSRVSHTVEVFPEDGEYAEIFALLRRANNVDFSKYKTSTVSRRIQRRIEMKQLSAIDDYVNILVGNPDELDALYRDLLIGVTEFFRDPEAFDQLRHVVAPEMLASASESEELRIWSACCATGEEAYSLAIILAEAAEELNYYGKITIFATDVHKRSLETASSGLYGRDRMKNVSTDRLARYFRQELDDTWRVVQDIRRMVVFAPHNVISDPPFTKTDLICCRNMLIYLTPDIQDKVITTFHYALKVSGILFLGSSEGLGSFAGEFETVNAHCKMFSKKRDLRLPLDFQTGQSLTRFHTAARTPPTTARSINFDRQLLNDYDLLLDQYMPAGVLVDENRQVLHIFGNMKPYFCALKGRADSDILAMIAEELHVAVITTMQKAVRDKTSAMLCGIQFPSESNIKVTFTVKPLYDSRVKMFHYFISFHSEEFRPLPANLSTNGEPARNFEEDRLYRQQISDLDQELKLTRENLQAANEELQTSNEELQATNEELLASNEELQSTNEELHSVNEELFTVNSEFERKNKELKDLNFDHENLLSSIDVGTLFIDSRFCIRKFNVAITGFFRLLPQDIGRPIEHIAYHLSDQSKLMDDIHKVLTTGHPIEKEDSSPSGSRHILIRILPFRTDTGVVAGVVVLFTDITRIKEAELTVQRLHHELEERYEELGHNYEKEKIAGEQIRDELRLKNEDISEAQRIASMAAFKWDIANNKIALAQSFCQFFPALDTSTPFDQSAFLHLVHAEDREMLLEQASSLTVGERRQIELRMASPDDNPRHMVCSMRHSSEGESTGMIVGLMHDITERKLAQQRLQENEALLRARLEAIASPDIEISADDLVRIFDAPAVQDMMNEFFTATGLLIGILDLKGNVMVATGWQRICTGFHRVNEESCKNCLESDVALASGVPEGEFKLYRCKNGMWDMVTPLVAEGKHFANVYLGQFFFDDEKPDIEYFKNQAKQYGFNQHDYLAALSDVPIFSREKVEHAMTFYARFSSLIARLCVSSVRIAKTLEASKRTEAQLRESQKMEAIGILAGGIAHDFNNVLQAITGYAALLKMSPEFKPDMTNYLDCIEQGCSRASELTHGLLAYSRKQTLAIMPCNLVQIVDDAVRLVRRIIGEHIVLHLAHENDDLPVYADITQIQHIFINLITNARDAMPSGGKLTITTGIRELDPSAAMKLSVSPGVYTFSEVSDTGTGMSVETCSHIFEPFFTTKEVGKGTGLGLAIVFGIIKQHDGYITCNSIPGEGTTFTVLLPLKKYEYFSAQPEQDQPKAIGGSETILLVEDEPAVRSVGSAILGKYGYNVIEAAEGHEALELFQNNPNSIDMLITDIVMPGKSGQILAAEILSINPSVPVLFTSGYPMRDMNIDTACLSDSNYIKKPVKPQELLRKVRNALDHGTKHSTS